MKYNVLIGIVDVVEADSRSQAIEVLEYRLRQAGFEPYEGIADLLPENYEQAYESEEQ